MVSLLLELFHILFALFVSLNHLVFAQESNQFVYNGFLGANLSLSGFARIHPNGLLELTDTSDQQIGHAFFPLPLHFHNANTSLSNNTNSSFSFSTNFVFAIVPESPSFGGGHGIAFTISPSVDFTGATATQYLGLFNSSSIGLTANHVLAIELDTIQNAEFGDINDNHVGVDVNSLTSIQSAPAMYFPKNDGRNESLHLISGKAMQVWIDYDEDEKLLNVTLAPVTGTKADKPLLSTKVDLSQVFLDSMYVGFSSSTGTAASHHYILGWSFNRSSRSQSVDIKKLPSFSHAGDLSNKLDLRILVPVIAVFVMIAVVSVAVLIMKKRYEEIREDWEQQYGPQRFSYKDLHRATKGFGDKRFLGSGGFGRVYRGKLASSDMEIAVKKVSHDSQQGMKEFVAEIASMGRLRHRHLVNLLGYCRRKGELFLVYDYMPNGSLDQFLFSNEKPCLNWSQRHQILKGVASALLYLHEEWEQVVLHRDIKASNVMLDSDFNGRLGDFGLAKSYDHGSTPQTTLVAGTFGYLAPEVARTGRATPSSDVFACGVFMLEVACGRRPIEPQRPHDEVVLVDWVLECCRGGNILRTSDPRLESDYEEEEMDLVLKLGLLCAHHTPAARPSMRQVVQYLEGSTALPELTLHVIGSGFVPGSYEAFTEHRITSHTENPTSYSSFGSDSILSSGR